MKQLFRSFLAAKRNRRRLVLQLALRLLRFVRDIEFDEMERFETLICAFDTDSYTDSQLRFINAEDEWSASEHALGFLDSAIDDLFFAY